MIATMTLLPPPQLRHAPSARLTACVVLATVALIAGCREAGPDDGFDNSDLARLALLVRDSSEWLGGVPVRVDTLVVLPLAKEEDVSYRWCAEHRKGGTHPVTKQWMPSPPVPPLPLDPNAPLQVLPIAAVFNADLRLLEHSKVLTDRLRSAGTLWIQPVKMEHGRVLARIGRPMRGVYVEATIRGERISITSECVRWEV